MKKIFIDTNIIIDLLADRKPHSKFAIALFVSAEQKQITLFTSPISIANAHYILKKYIPENKLRALILGILDYVNIVTISEDTIKKGLRSVHKDFEDALQIVCAGSIGKLDCIVTRDRKDFQKSEIPVYSPDQVVQFL
jgi:predicted nucleic acid-binding protein